MKIEIANRVQSRWDELDMRFRFAFAEFYRCFAGNLTTCMCDDFKHSFMHMVWLMKKNAPTQIVISFMLMSMAQFLSCHKI